MVAKETNHRVTKVGSFLAINWVQNCFDGSRVIVNGCLTIKKLSF